MLASLRVDTVLKKTLSQIDLWKHLTVLTCFNVSEHGFESWQVAALKSVQESSHAPHLNCHQLIINVFQVLTPARPWRRGSTSEHLEMLSGCDAPLSYRQTGALPQVPPQRLSSSCESPDIC